jgi:hypothetical protein
MTRSSHMTLLLIVIGVCAFVLGYLLLARF